MRSLKLGKIFGIRVELHSTFVWLAIIGVIWLAFAEPPENFVPTIILFFFLFASVFLHELVHSVVAVDKGCTVEKIILLPIGGISVSEELPKKPKDEFLIAVVGPLFNFIVAAGILAVAWLGFASFPNNLLQLFFSDYLGFWEAVLTYPLVGLLYVNILLASFNLFVPALPLDGGRVARSLLATQIGFRRATAAIARVSVFIAIFLFLIGFLAILAGSAGGFIIAIIAAFIYFGAQQEREAALLSAVLADERIGPLVNKRPAMISPDATVAEAMKAMLQKRQLALLVHLPDKEFGLLDIDSIAKLDKEQWGSLTAASVCKKVKPLKPSAASADTALKMFSKSQAMLPVVSKGKLLGVIEARELRKQFELKKPLK